MKNKFLAYVWTVVMQSAILHQVSTKKILESLQGKGLRPETLRAFAFYGDGEDTGKLWKLMGSLDRAIGTKRIPGGFSLLFLLTVTTRFFLLFSFEL